MAGADQSEAGLRRRLVARGFTDEAIEAAIARLTEFGYINDEKLSASITQRKLRQGFGRRRVAADLRGRGMSDEAIDKALVSVDPESEVQSCLEAATKWARSHPGSGSADKRRLGAALQRRGFGFDVIRTVIAQIEASR
jgi:regulatory protein